MKEEVLDPTCGGRTIWYDSNKDRDDVLYLDKREEEEGFTGQPNRTYSVEPDERQDFRDLPYEDESFNHIVWDPPHEVTQNGMQELTGYIHKSYGALKAETWQHDLKKGFEELWRVLNPSGTLVFKFANSSVHFKDVLDLFPVDPLYGTMTKQNSNCENRWFLFYKPENQSFSKQKTEGETE